MSMGYVFLILFSASRLLQWTVAPTTSVKSEACRVLRATRNGCGHNVNNGGTDGGTVLISARYCNRSARRVTRLPTGFHAGANTAFGRCFHHRPRAHFSAPNSDERTLDGPERGGSGAIQLRRCAATYCRRRAILSSNGRTGYSVVSERPCAPVPCGIATIMHRTRRPPCVTRVSLHVSPDADIHRDES